MLENEYSIVKQKSSKTIYSKEKSLKTIRHDTQKQDDSFLSREMHLKNISITKFENDKDSTKNICNFKKDNGNNNSVLKSKCGMPSILDISSLNKNESIQQKSLNCFKNQSIRRKFIINIVGLVIIMLLIVSVTVSITCIPSIRKWLSSPENKLHIYGIFYITFALWVIVYLVTVCCKNFRRHFPWNVILVILNTLAISILTALLTLYVEVYLILFTVLATIIIVTIIGLLVYFQFVDITKKRHLWKLTLFSPMIFTLLIVLNLTFHQTTFLQNIILFIIILLSVMYLFIDLQMILNDERNKIGPNDTVFAVIILFTDIVHIFMSIISFFNKKY